MFRDLRSFPLIAALLRAMTLLAVIEAIFFRFLAPEAPLPASLRGTMIRAAMRAGETVFIPAFALATICLGLFAAAALRRPIWPAGPNGFIASTLLCLVVLSVVAVGPSSGPLMVLGFTTLSFVALCVVAMQAFASERSIAARGVAIVYTAAAACSFLGQAMRLTLPAGSPDTAWRAGALLLEVAGVLAFFAWFDLHPGAAASRRRVAAIAFATAISAAFLWIRSMEPGSLQWRDALTGGGFFLAAVTALSALLDPGRRAPGLGMLFLILAGYPLRIAYQQLLMVLGAVLLFLPPEPAKQPAYIPEGEVPGSAPALLEDPSVRT